MRLLRRAARPRLRPGDRIASYLPSAHIADRCARHYTAIVYGSQITASPTRATVVAALPDVRPTSGSRVPRVWEKLKAALEAPGS